MRLSPRLIPRSLVAQITAIVAASVALGVVLVMAAVFVLSDGGTEHNPSAAAARIADLTRLVQAARTPEEATDIIEAAQRAGVNVTHVSASDAGGSAPDGAVLPLATRIVTRQLESTWGIDVIEDAASSNRAGALIVGIGDYGTLRFETWPSVNLSHFVLAPTALILTIIVIFVTMLSVYAVRSITAPLGSLARAAQSFGRSSEDGGPISRSGPSEIALVADALNDMRTRIRALLDERTRMLTGISHDLRTPLTRLRLRVERVAEQDLREGMMQEVSRVTHMLDETLHYLREDVRSEPASRIDLPSVLQTVCNEFADVGHAVSYAGPPRLTWTCRPNLLKRAISNVVDNAVKHGRAVIVTMRARDDGSAEIDVADDGPGVPASMREAVFAPFFKGDDARSPGTPGGFGLGLSIARDIVRNHGGEVDLLDRTPHGLIVRLSLPVVSQAAVTGTATTLNTA